MPVNTAALKSFAPAMRRQLIEAVGRKLDLLLTSQTPDTLSTYAKQIAELREQAAENREQLLEQVAYSWFNRLAALRYLDAKGWHPFGCRVLMPAGGGETQPELLKLMRSGSLPLELKEHTNENRLNGLLDGQIPTAIAGADPQGEVYRELVLATCHSYHQLLPNLFEGLDDASELLLPDDLLTEGSIAGGFRQQISDDDCQDVESLGWLYQFYIAEKKDEVMARKKAVPTEDIPAVTQLFTPHWIVRYLVENSLGRLWLLNRPSSGLKAHMPYYIEGEAETDFLVINKPEEIKLLDPACGSGHMLTYAFDLLVLIYEEEGYSPNEIPGLILKNNLHGLEICPRAAQLAELALVFKAREKSRRFFQPEHLVRPHIIELRDVRFAENELRDYIHALGLGDLFNQPMLRLLHQFEEAKNFGSLIQPCLDERAIDDLRRAIEAKDLGGQLFLRETHLKVLRVLEQAEALSPRYHVVVANPPYMSDKGMTPRMKTFVEDGFPLGKNDLFACFTERGLALVVERGYCALVTMQVWMFVASYEALRLWLLKNTTFINFVQIGFNSFPELNSKFALAVAFVSKAAIPKNAVSTCVNLNDAPKSADKQSVFEEKLRSRDFHLADFQTLLAIPGCPVAYWITKQGLAAFENLASVQDFADAKSGQNTGDNERFIRSWSEISFAKIGFGYHSLSETCDGRHHWFPYNKGGKFRKWFGNRDHVINWHLDGREVKAYAVERNQGKHWSRYLQNLTFMFREGVTWTFIGYDFSARYADVGFLFDYSGCSMFPHKPQHLHYFLGLLCSKVSPNFLSVLNQTLNYQPGNIASLPSPNPDSVQTANTIKDAVVNAVSIARADWDNFETSWDFRDQPLLRPGLKGLALEASWRNWEVQSTAAIRRMQELETENNRLFIAAYGLDGELQPEVPEAQITLARAEARRDMAAFLSYAVGCMMGRYFPDHPGLILANAGDTLENYNAKVGKSSDAVAFQPDRDGIIPVLDGEWFEDDIVARSREFLAVTFPESSVVDNLRFIEDSLGKDIRKYFCTDFYKDHLQTYKKRPIYWLVQSPKKGFGCLIYLHRYTKDTLNLVLNNYFRPYLQKLEARLAQLGLDQLNDDLPTRERTAARKEAEKITKVLKECQAWEQDALLPLAQQRIELDLDDGVKVNYLKLQDVLAPIPGLAAKEE